MSSKNFMDDIGLNRIGFVDDQYVVELDVKTKHLNSIGIIHGGVLCTLLDTAMAFALVETLTEDKKECATLEMKINIFRPTVSGKLTAYGVLTNLTNRTAFLEGVIKNQEGKLVTKASSTIMFF
jgi:uncharacterized protein (TIGR00369 family)